MSWCRRLGAIVSGVVVPEDHDRQNLLCWVAKVQVLVPDAVPTVVGRRDNRNGAADDDRDDDDTVR